MPKWPVWSWCSSIIILTNDVGTTTCPDVVYSIPCTTLYLAWLPFAAFHTPYRFWSYSYKISISFMNVERGVKIILAKVWYNGLAFYNAVTFEYAKLCQSQPLRQTQHWPDSVWDNFLSTTVLATLSLGLNWGTLHAWIINLLVYYFFLIDTIFAYPAENYSNIQPISIAVHLGWVT